MQLFAAVDPGAHEFVVFLRDPVIVQILVIGLGEHVPLRDLAQLRVGVALHQFFFLFRTHDHVRGPDEGLAAEFCHVFGKVREDLMVTKLVAQVLVTLHILHDDVVIRLVVQIDFGDEGRAVFPLQLQHFAFDLAAVETDVPVRVDPQRILGVLDDERLAVFVLHPEHVVDVAVGEFGRFQLGIFPEKVGQILLDKIDGGLRCIHGVLLTGRNRYAGPPA